MNFDSRAAALILSCLLTIASHQPAHASEATNLLVKVHGPKTTSFVSSLSKLAGHSAQISPITQTLHDGTRWVAVKSASKSRTLSVRALQSMPGVVMVQPNYPIRLMHDFKLPKGAQRDALQHQAEAGTLPVSLTTLAKADNPAIPGPSTPGLGADSLFSQQWGMSDNNVVSGWKGAQGEGFVVAVLDTGVDYTHEDLVDNMWRNPGETGVDASGNDMATNGIDDDGNGYIDDVVGWDFAANDNKPFDLSVTPFELLLGGGNPGHGTHCAGNVAARGDNGKGVAGVAPKTKIMALRFIGETGEGSTEAAIKAIEYTMKMGVKVSSNSWGSSGEDPEDAAGNQALKDVLEASRLAGQLFVAAAGNGDTMGVGYDNDTNAAPAYPASYGYEHIISVAAIDKGDGLGTFSNWGAKTVDIGAPGVAVFSTVVENGYTDKVIDFPEFNIVANWDGTSMAAPHVAGAAALYWADNPLATAADVKKAILDSAKPISSLQGKAVTNGKLSVENLMK